MLCYNRIDFIPKTTIELHRPIDPTSIDIVNHFIGELNSEQCFQCEKETCLPSLPPRLLVVPPTLGSLIMQARFTRVTRIASRVITLLTRGVSYPPCPFYSARYPRFNKLEIAAPATLMVLTLSWKRARSTRVPLQMMQRILTDEPCTLRVYTCYTVCTEPLFAPDALAFLVSRHSSPQLFPPSLSYPPFSRLASPLITNERKLTKCFQRYATPRLWFMAIRLVILCRLRARDRIWYMDGTRWRGMVRRVS